MALSGHDTPIAVISDAGTKSTYTGTLNGVVAGQLVRVAVTACSDTAGTTPSAWTVTLGPDTLAYEVGDAPGSTYGVAAEFWVIATTSGNLTLTVSTVKNCRGLDAHANLITGFNTGTPIAASGAANSHSSNSTSLTAPNGMTPGATGNAILGCLGVNGGGATGMAVTGADGSITGQSGPNAFNDHSWCYAYAIGAPPATLTFAYSWSGGSTQPRPAAAWVEIKAAAGSSTLDIAGESVAFASGALDLAAAGSIDIGGEAIGFASGGVDLVDPAANDLPISGEVIAFTGGGIDLIAAGTIDIGGEAIPFAPGALNLVAGGQIVISGEAIPFASGNLDLTPPGSAPRRAAYARDSRVIGTLRADYG